MNTSVINLFGGPGTGKSTLSAEIFYKLKKQGKSGEIVREYVKDWAWQNRKIRAYDQMYIFGKQSHKESILYHKVETIVTDSPIILGAFYLEYYDNNDMLVETCKKYYKYASDNGIKYYNFFLKRNKEYDPNGRYENEEQAKAIDLAIIEFLNRNELTYYHVDVEDNIKADYVLGIFNKNVPFHGLGE